MKICFINARNSSSSIIPTGLLSIATLLKKEGHEVSVFDRPMNDDILFHRIKKYNADMIGISFMTTEYNRAKIIIEWCRKNFKKKIIFAGGYHVSALPELSLRDLNLDFVVIGEGEITMLEICNKYSPDLDLKNIKGIAYIKKNKFIKNLPRPFIENLDTLPVIDRELIDGGIEWYLTLPGNIRGHLIERCTTIITSRGCPGNCIFCSSRAMWSSHVRQRSVKNVIKEIDYLVNKYNIKGLFFLDDTFTYNKKWILKFCKEFSKKNYKIKWGCSSRVNTISDEILYSLKNAGCIQIDFGVESGSDKVLNFMRKGQNKKIIINAFNLIHKYKMKSLACFIIGSPGETKEEMEKTFEIAKKIKPNYAIFSILTPLPGSTLYDMALNNKWIKKNMEFGFSWSIRHSENPIMCIEYSAKELLKIREKMEDYFFIKNYLHYLIPLITKPFFIIQLLYMIFRSPIKYLKYLTGNKTRRFSGFIESIYYDYKDWKAKKIK